MAHTPVHTLVALCLNNATAPMTADEVIRVVREYTFAAPISIRQALRKAVRAGEANASMDKQRNYTYTATMRTRPKPSKQKR